MAKERLDALDARLKELLQRGVQLQTIATNSAEEKKELRLEQLDLEDSLRKLRDQLSEIEIENQSYQVLSDAEKQLREARNEAEASAAKSVNEDLKQHLKRLKKDIEVGEQNREGS